MGEAYRPDEELRPICSILILYPIEDVGYVVIAIMTVFISVYQHKSCPVRCTDCWSKLWDHSRLTVRRCKPHVFDGLIEGESSILYDDAYIDMVAEEARHYAFGTTS